jgi:cold shock CspA family protein
VAGHTVDGQTGGRGQIGAVESFDSHVGLGQVRVGDGRLFPFHCTEIVDGSREIPVGTRVEFVVAPGQLGMWEARAVAPEVRA